LRWPDDVMRPTGDRSAAERVLTAHRSARHAGDEKAPLVSAVSECLASPISEPDDTEEGVRQHSCEPRHREEIETAADGSRYSVKAPKPGSGEEGE